MFFIAVDDQVRPLLLVVQLGVGEDAGEFEDAIIDWIEAAHFEIHPEELGYKSFVHYIIMP
jgi:hypothetical protein